MAKTPTTPKSPATPKSPTKTKPPTTTRQVPSIGRIVHYVLESGKHRPAIIVHVWSPEHFMGTSQLQVFCDGDGGAYNDGLPNVIWRTSVAHDEDEMKPNTWHFPEFVPPVEVIG